MNDRPIGRRPGDPEDTRQQILAAARSRFGALGFERATIRGIAEQAGVDPALVIHHFTNKRTLFITAHELPIDPGPFLAALAAQPRETHGEQITRMYLMRFAVPGSPVLSLLRAAATNEDAAAMVRGFVETTLFEHGTPLVEGPDPELRLALMVSQLAGAVIAREILGLTALRERPLEDIVGEVAPVIQRYLEGNAPPPTFGRPDS